MGQVRSESSQGPILPYAPPVYGLWPNACKASGEHERKATRRFRAPPPRCGYPVARSPYDQAWARGRLSLEEAEELIEELQQQAAQLEEQAADLEALTDQLTTSEARLRGMVGSALDAIIATDAHSTIIEWNHRAEAVFGWSAPEAIGRTLGETIIPPQHREAHNRGVQHYLSTGEGHP